MTQIYNKKQIQSKLSFSIKKESMLTKILEETINFTNEINLQFNEDGMELNAFHPLRSLLMDLFFNKEQFELYSLKDRKSVVLGIKLGEFIKIFKIAKKNSFIQINYNLNQNDWLEAHTISGNNTKIIHKLRLIDLDCERLDVPEINYEIILASDMKSLYDDFYHLSSVKDGKKYKITCSLNNTNLLMKIETDLGNSHTIKFDENNYSISKKSSPHLGSFNLRYILKCLKFCKIGVNGTISMSKDCPMKISFNIGEKSKLQFFAAPLVGDESEESDKDTYDSEETETDDENVNNNKT